MQELEKISTDTELKEYILEKLAMGGILESEVETYIYFGNTCNHMQTYVYYKAGKYCYTYMGIRKEECFTSMFNTKEELLKRVIEDIAVAKVCSGKIAKKCEEYALELALRIDDKVVELIKNGIK